MKMPPIAGVSLTLLALLSACDRHDPPSEQLERAAEELVSEVETGALPAQPPAGPWAPRNECNGLPGGTDFLASLQAAIDTRDADALVALAADDVKLDFGGGAGRAQLRDRLVTDEGALWGALVELFALGCAATDETTMTLPWYFAQEIPVDPYMGAIVAGEDVPLYAAPGSNAEVAARLSWDAVEGLPSETAGAGNEFVRWTDPESGDVVEGYIASNSLRAIIDYRLIASRRNNRWHITALIAGD
jgi:hypothetical protein